jgi:hypothetical protein
VEGENRISAYVKDYAGNIGLDYTEITYEPPIYSQYVDSRGDTIQAPDGTTLYIPRNALLKGITISIRTVSTKDLSKPLGNITLIENAHDFDPDGLVFHKPVTIILPYTDSSLDINQDGNPDFQENQLDVFHLEGNIWIKTIAMTRDPILNRIGFETNHFSVYALGNGIEDESIKFYWTRNPFNPQDGTTAVMELTEPGKITLKIYDISGDLVRTLAENETVTGTSHRRWDGLNDFDRYVGSGIYIYIFKFDGDDGRESIIKKPIGVIK